MNENDDMIYQVTFDWAASDTIESCFNFFVCAGVSGPNVAAFAKRS